VTNPQLINQTSGKTEYYTPPFIIESARLVMGGIDMDPASSAAANERVQAMRYYTEAEDGLSKQWYGHVWMNHPFSRDGNAKWINKLLEEYKSGRVVQACCITFACTSEKWFQPLLPQHQCFLSPRTNYLLPDGSTLRGVTKGSVVTYFGVHNDTFKQVFSAYGVVK
jgi:hypothetical protein